MSLSVRAAVLALVLLSPFAARAGAALVSPAPGETIHSNTGTVNVVVTGAPAEARFQAVLDGAPRGRISAAPSFVIEGVDRGTHQLAVALFDADGKETGRTEAVEFHLWHASRLFPNRRPKP